MRYCLASAQLFSVRHMFIDAPRVSSRHQTNTTFQRHDGMNTRAYAYAPAHACDYAHTIEPNSKNLESYQGLLMYPWIQSHFLTLGH